MHNFGKRAKDKITGFEGIIVGKTAYLYGCDVYGITPPAKDGEVKDACWFDEGRVEILGDGVDPAEVRALLAGGLGMAAPNNRVR